LSLNCKGLSSRTGQRRTGRVVIYRVEYDHPEEEAEALQRRRAEKEQRRAQQGEGLPPPEKAKTRLPHGSRFKVQYDAEKAQWTGTLTVPASGQATAATFTGSQSSLFKLLANLDDQYRATLR
jgi:hypothetical protein